MNFSPVKKNHEVYFSYIFIFIYLETFFLVCCADQQARKKSFKKKKKTIESRGLGRGEMGGNLMGVGRTGQRKESNPKRPDD